MIDKEKRHLEILERLKKLKEEKTEEPKEKKFRWVYQPMHLKDSIGKEYKYKKCALNWIHKQIIFKQNISFTVNVWLNEVQISEGCMSPGEYKLFLKYNAAPNYFMNGGAQPLLIDEGCIIDAGPKETFLQFKRDQNLNNLFE